MLRNLGPGILVTAAFIGPGTITTASAAGAGYGYVLVWALLFSVIATAVLQEMAARLGLVTRAGLAAAMRETFSHPLAGRAAVLLVIAAVGFGNAAYQAGNIAGAALALDTALNIDSSIAAVLIGGFAAALLASGRYLALESVLVVLVLLMSVVFIWTALLAKPDWAGMAAALWPPELPRGGALLALALVGTTVVPYNLFLHASAVIEKWPADQSLDSSLRQSRMDTRLSVGLGGLITLAILSTAATAFFATGTAFSGQSMASQLEPSLGSFARYVFAAGLFASGLTSAITAPLAAAWAVSGALGWPADLKDNRSRAVWLTVLVSGTVFAALESSPVAAILFAQAANGFLLPLVAAFLLLVMNNETLLGEHRNSPLANVLGVLVVLVALGLGGVKLAGVFGLL